jgi:hypothetical protein
VDDTVPQRAQAGRAPHKLAGKRLPDIAVGGTRPAEALRSGRFALIDSTPPEPRRASRRNGTAIGSRPSRWSRATLMTDGCFLLIMGVLTVVLANQSHANGSGPFGNALERQPYVVGFVEAALLIAVIGGGLLTAGLLTPIRLWHIFAMLAHITLASIDLSYRDTMASMDLATANLTALAVIHALFTTAHVTCLFTRERAPATG